MTDTPSTTPEAPATGAATPADPNRVPSAGDDPNAQRAITVADPTNVVVIDGHEAAKTEPADTNVHGLAWATPEGQVAGGNIKKTLDSPINAAAVSAPMAKERAALQSPIGQKIAGFVGRPISEWGLVAEGEVIHGYGLFLDLITGEKVQVMDGHKVNKGTLLANLRNFPEALSTGSVIEDILKGS